jgi:hypothetical protein
MAWRTATLPAIPIAIPTHRSVPGRRHIETAIPRQAMPTNSSVIEVARSIPAEA